MLFFLNFKPLAAMRTGREPLYYIRITYSPPHTISNFLSHSAVPPPPQRILLYHGTLTTNKIISFVCLCAPMPLYLYANCPLSDMVIAWLVFPDEEPRLSICFTISIPFVTLPNTTCFPSNHGVSAVVMKNCREFQ